MTPLQGWGRDIYAIFIIGLHPMLGYAALSGLAHFTLKNTQLLLLIQLVLDSQPLHDNPIAYNEFNPSKSPERAE